MSADVSEAAAVLGKLGGKKGGRSKSAAKLSAARANLKKAGAPVEPEEIGVTRARFRETLRGVPYMRSRYFGLDLVLELGLMDALTDRLFGKQGIWAV